MKSILAGSGRLPSFGCSVGPCRQCARRALTLRHALPTLPNLPNFFAKEEKKEEIPRPNAKFTKEDLKRIKKNGPTLDDIQLTFTYTPVPLPGMGEVAPVTEAFVPPTCFGTPDSKPEPKWDEIPEMPLNLFIWGLKKRNWTSPVYDPSAPKWNLEIWRDRGKFFRPTFEGYRVLITDESTGEVKWANAWTPGHDNRFIDRVAGGSPGGIYNWPREHVYSGDPYEIGYNQMFEEIFEALEERLPAQVTKHIPKQRITTVPRTKMKMNTEYERFNPHLQHLDISYWWTEPPPSFSIWGDDGELFWTLVASLFIFVVVGYGIYRRKTGPPKDFQEAIEFSQSSAKARKDGTTRTTLADVAGLDSIKYQFEEIILFLKDPEAFKATGVRPPKGVLLEGLPGTGKTLIAKAIAGEANVGFYQMAGSEFVETIVGVGAARVRDLFKRAGAYKEPTLIFVDEIDALALRRATGSHKANEEREQTLNQLLTEIDGFNPSTGIVFIAATNRAQLLDPALMRAGRFDRKISLGRPNSAARYDILQVHARAITLSDDVDMRQVAHDTPGLVGADLANLLNEAAMAAARESLTVVGPSHVQYALDRVMLGPAQAPGDTTGPIGAKLNRALAVSEAARGVLSITLHEETGVLDPVGRVSIVRRGDSLSRTVYVRGSDEEYVFITKQMARESLLVAIVGHAAEELLGMDLSTYSAQNFVTAGMMLDRYIHNYSFSDLGVTTWAPGAEADSEEFEDDKTRTTDVAHITEEDMLRQAELPGLLEPVSDMNTHIEAHKVKIMKELYSHVVAKIKPSMPAVKLVAAALEEKRELTHDEVKELMRQGAESSTTE